MNEGIPMIQDYLSSDLSISNMNGYSIPEYGFDYFNDSLNVSESTSIIKPIKNDNYETYTYNYLDLVYKSDQKILNNKDDYLCKNGLSIYGYYNNNIWYDDILNNRTQFFTNHYSITLKGKLGHNGIINNKLSNNNNIMNKNIDGFEVLDIGYDSNSNKNILKLNLQLSSIGVNTPQNYLGSLENITNNTIKNNYIIGYGGNIFQKKVFKNVSTINSDKYIYLSIDKLNNIIGTNKTQYFTKILLNNAPGSHLYDSFINSEIIYESDSLDELSELEIKFVNDEGKLFNFEGSEHSFMLEIIEEDYNLIQN